MISARRKLPVVVSKGDSDLQAEKTQSPKESCTTSAVTRDDTIDMSIGQGDVWEEVSLVDADAGWNSIESDYYLSDDDVTVKEHAEDGEWLSIDHKDASHEQHSPPVVSDKVIKKLEISLRKTSMPPQNRSGTRRNASLHDTVVSSHVRKPRSVRRQVDVLELKSAPCKPVCSEPVAQPSWKAESQGEMGVQTALAMVDVTEEMRERMLQERGFIVKETRPQAEAPAEPGPSTRDAETATGIFFFSNPERLGTFH
ncbi:hypothetical protein GGR58DRAFT_373506 [Xylaria digitata]|nr:hypothetical protein GGR58DRAFT_373506 [Xylaria digitata]